MKVPSPRLRYVVLWTLQPSTQYFKPEFEVNYDVLIERFNHLFLPWISPEVKQMNEGRLAQALEFLNSISWIR